MFTYVVHLAADPVIACGRFPFVEKWGLHLGFMFVGGSTFVGQAIGICRLF